MNNQPKVAIVVLNWNGKQDTLNCLHSLRNLKYDRFEIIVVDNGSTDDSVSTIKATFPSMTLLCSDKNLGFAGGNNIGIEYALKTDAAFILLLNNDTEVDPHLLAAFVMTMQKYPRAGILGAKLFLFEHREQFDHFGGFWNKKRAAFDLVANRAMEDHLSWEKETPLDYACGCALFVRKQVFERIGLLEPSFFLIWEEADFCFRARRADFTTLFCPQAKLWHKVSASFSGGKPHSTYFWWRNRLLWIERNRPLLEKLLLYGRILIPEMAHLLKLRIIKGIEWKILCLFNRSDQKPEKFTRLVKYRAALEGIKDYFLRRFGNGPAWIYKKDSCQSRKIDISRLN